MRKRKRTHLSVLLFVLLPLLLFAQQGYSPMAGDVSQNASPPVFRGFFSDFPDLNDPLSINGKFGLTARTYKAWEGENRQPPFYWIVNTNLNLKIHKLNIPFSALIAIDRQELDKAGAPGLKETISKRFNRIGASPHYRWVKFHLGHRNMNFSPFTLANLTFLGVGAELTPGNMRFATMYGRLDKAEPRDLSLTEPNLPVFERMGWGVKLGYGTKDDFVDLILFKAWDDERSIPVSDAQTVFANENVVVGLKLQKYFLDRVRLTVDYATSALTPNLNDAIITNKRFPHFGVLLDPRETTEYNNAFESGLDYMGLGFNLGVKYRRIDPNYRSLGAYFFDNDIEDYTANANWSMLKNKVNVSGSAGFQRDNLGDLKPSTMTRFIGSANLNYADGPFSAGLNYSNYSADIEYVLDPELDSLNVVIATQDLGATATYSLSSQRENRHLFTLAANLQEVVDDINDPEQSAESSMLNLNFVYAYLIKEGNWNLTSNLNYNKSAFSGTDVSRWGMGLGLTKAVLRNRLLTGFNFNYYKASVATQNNIQNQTLTVRLRCNYRVSKNHSFMLNYALLNRKRTDDSGLDDPFTEGIGNVGYQYNFGWKPGRK